MTETRYVRSGDAHIAYQVKGDGPIDVLMSSYINISIDAFEREPRLARFLERLESYARVIRYDARGIGLSDPISPDAPPTLEQRVADALAVLDDVGSERAALFAPFTSGPPAIVFAATHPGRTQALVLCNTYARAHRGPDYPYGDEVESFEVRFDEVVTPRPDPPAEDIAALHAPSLADDRAYLEWWKGEGRRGASPTVAAVLVRLYFLTDVRDVLPTLSVPTLVLGPTRDNGLGVPDHSRYLAEHIAGARFVELDQADLYPFSPNGDLLADEVEEFLTGTRRRREPERVLATILFTDIVRSTELAAEMGDQDWRQLLDRHDAMVRRQIDRFDGREVKTTGDGFLVTFTGPTPAVRCAAAVRDGAAQLGISVRAGVHTGEVELRGEDIGGIAVHLAQRVASLAGADEICASGTVKDLVFGSGIDFEDRGEHDLKGVPGRWRIHAVRR
ncbi:MAG TPA: adenylate/guanylate cyclase domain-containing protein [Actinomycetota bacterium]|nr:adenylate/guanylate cyclase domain-containing protein [Actinomycetota bacterium]